MVKRDTSPEIAHKEAAVEEVVEEVSSKVTFGAMENSFRVLFKASDTRCLLLTGRKAIS